MPTASEKRLPALPPLNALRALDALARCGSLRTAASDLGVVPGAVRLQLAGLEEHFGIALLSRQGGRVTLNPAGQRLADAVGVAFAIISRAAEEAVSQGLRVRLRVGVPVPMAAAWFVPRLPRMLTDMKALEIDIVPIAVTLSLTDAPDIDVMIVGGEYRPLPDIDATMFLDDEFGPVISPGLTMPAEAGVADMAELDALVPRNVGYLWDDWFRESGNTPVRFRRRIEFEDLTLSVAAAKAGLGVTIAPRASIEAELASGVLVAPFGFVRRPAGFRICCRIADRDHKPIAALRSWLVAEGRSSARSEEKLLT
ncbi:LysR family transcriptional regulator [Rhizobium sp. KVB221]|uniref:LysR family transcriptional regulator n=1 Tax=Rhizobium setariae TaxID=2801340 RepID=A0A937CLV9_9HYPH|nr:LysR substrate-binding domain-containing protein [Rhizobium setariae]MBL0373595.1 LysR family transcriptional regulator [Rhizobium setariae]